MIFNSNDSNTKDFPKEIYCTCVYVCNLIIRYVHLAVLVR